MSDLLNLLWIDQDELKIPIKGIPNLGNTCYIASITQCLVRFPGIRDYVNEVKENDEPAANDLSLRACTFRLISDYLNKRCCSEVNVSPQMKALQKATRTESAPFTCLYQHDADEYYHKLVEKLPTEFGEYIKKTASLTVTQRSRCTRCELVETQEKEVSQSLSVALHGNTIENSLKNLFKTVTRSSTECTCNPTGYYKMESIGSDATKRRVVAELGFTKKVFYSCVTECSEVLYINLTRPLGLQKQVRISKKIVIGKELLCSEEHAEQQYELFAVVYKSGPPEAGHWWATCKTKLNWKTFSDVSVRDASPPYDNNNLSQFVRGLFYRRL